MGRVRWKKVDGGKMLGCVVILLGLAIEIDDPLIKYVEKESSRAGV